MAVKRSCGGGDTCTNPLHIGCNPNTAWLDTVDDEEEEEDEEEQAV